MQQLVWAAVMASECSPLGLAQWHSAPLICWVHRLEIRWRLSEGRGAFGARWKCEPFWGWCGAWGGVHGQSMHPTRNGPIGDRAILERNTIGVSAVDSRTISSEVAHNLVITRKPVFWSQPGSPGRRSRAAAHRWRRPHKGILHGA